VEAMTLSYEERKMRVYLTLSQAALIKSKFDEFHCSNRIPETDGEKIWAMADEACYYAEVLPDYNFNEDGRMTVDGPGMDVW
jgi:hypothetical protein